MEKTTRPKRSTGKFIFLLIVLVAGFFILDFTNNPARNLVAPDFPDPASPPVLGQTSYSGVVHGMNGSEVPMSRFKDKVVFLNFWASWCPPCKVEMPNMQALYEEVKDENDIIFLLISNEDREVVQNYMASKGYTFPVYTGSDALLQNFGVSGIPTTFILNRAGEVVFRHTGAAAWDNPESFAFLRGLT